MKYLQQDLERIISESNVELGFTCNPFDDVGKIETFPFINYDTSITTAVQTFQNPNGIGLFDVVIFRLDYWVEWAKGCKTYQEAKEQFQEQKQIGFDTINDIVFFLIHGKGLKGKYQRVATPINWQIANYPKTELQLIGLRASITLRMEREKECCSTVLFNVDNLLTNRKKKELGII